MQADMKITSEDINNFSKKLKEFETTLNDKEKIILSETVRLAGKSALDVALLNVTGETTTKKKLTLVRDNIQALNVWELLSVTRDIALWACPGKELGQDVINPPDAP